MNMTDDTKIILLQAGCYPSRSVDIQPYVDGLHSEGYVVHDAARRFLSEFGGLTIHHPAFRLREQESTTHFCAVEAAGEVWQERVALYEQAVHDELVVVGAAFNGYLTLLVGASGKVYGAYDTYLTCLGDDAYSAIDNICLGVRTEQIPFNILDYIDDDDGIYS